MHLRSIFLAAILGLCVANENDPGQNLRHKSDVSEADHIRMLQEGNNDSSMSMATILEPAGDDTAADSHSKIVQDNTINEEDEIVIPDDDEESYVIQSMEGLIKEEGVDITLAEAKGIIDHAKDNGMPLHHVKGGDKCVWVVETLLGKLLPHKPYDFIDHIVTKICGGKSTSTSSTTSTRPATLSCNFNCCTFADSVCGEISVGNCDDCGTTECFDFADSGCAAAVEGCDQACPPA